MSIFARVFFVLALLCVFAPFGALAQPRDLLRWKSQFRRGPVAKEGKFKPSDCTLRFFSMRRWFMTQLQALQTDYALARKHLPSIGIGGKNFVTLLFWEDVLKFTNKALDLDPSRSKFLAVQIISEGAIERIETLTRWELGLASPGANSLQYLAYCELNRRNIPAMREFYSHFPLEGEYLSVHSYSLELAKVFHFMSKKYRTLDEWRQTAPENQLEFEPELEHLVASLSCTLDDIGPIDEWTAEIRIVFMGATRDAHGRKKLLKNPRDTERFLRHCIAELNFYKLHLQRQSVGLGKLIQPKN